MYRNQSFNPLIHLSTLVLFFVIIGALTSSSLPVDLLHKHQMQSAKVAPNWPVPTKIIKGIPVYETFAELEPALHFKNDTLYIINFWATWCKPCVSELPVFEALTEKYQSAKMEVVLCSLDFPDQIESKLVPFVENRQLQSNVIALADGKFNNWIEKVSGQWSGAIPATYCYRQDQKLFLETSFENLSELEDAIKPLLIN